MEAPRRKARGVKLSVVVPTRGRRARLARVLDALPGPEEVPFNFFYTSNVSLQRATFESLSGFDDSFPSAAFEDVELAYRATRATRPLRIVFQPGARALHDHPTTLDAALAREAEK